MKFSVRFGLVALALSLLLATVANPAVAQLPNSTGSPYDDQRLKAWSADFLAGRFSQVMSSVEADLRIAKPHIFAPHVWARTAYVSGKLTADWRKGLDPQLLHQLGMTPELLRLYLDEDYGPALRLAKTIDLKATSDPFALLLVSWIASSTGDVGVEGAARARLSVSHPGLFISIWQMFNRASEVRNWPEIAAEFLKERGDKLPSAYRVATERILKTPNQGAINLYPIALDWLRTAPHDAFAHRQAAIQAAALYRWDDALKHIKKANSAYPFHLYEVEEARLMIRKRKFELADDLLDRWATLKGLPKGVEFNEFKKVLQAKALRLAGEFGRARELLLAALKRWPASLRLNRERVRLAIAANRYGIALDYSNKVIAHPQVTIEDHQRHLWVLKILKKYRAVVREFDALRTKQKNLSIGVYISAIDSLASLQQHSERLALAYEAVDKHPTYAPLHDRVFRALIANGLDELALKGVERFLANMPVPYAWSALDNLPSLVRKIHGDASVIPAIERYKGTHFRSKKFWSVLVEARTAAASDTEQRKTIATATWREAQDRNPEYIWPTMVLIKKHKDAKDYQKALSVLETVKKRYEQLLPAEKGRFHDERGYLIHMLRRDPKTKVPDERYAEAMNEFALAEANYASLSATYSWWSRMGTTLAFSRPRDARATLRRIMEIVPDSPIFRETRVLGQGKANLAGLHAAGLYARLQRRPNSVAVLGSALFFHTRWYGTGAYALSIAERLKSLHPDEYREKEELIASLIGRFGSPAQSFVMRYGNARRLSPSDRYIDWFDSARAKAYRDEKRFELDPDTRTVKIFHPDGAVEELRDEGRCGKPAMRRFGTTWVKATYDKVCNLSSASSSSGERVDLIYDRDNDKIIEIKDHTGDVLKFIYADVKDCGSKPTQISIVGVGRIDVTYSNSCQIKRVSSTAGHKVSLRVTRAFQRMLGLVKSFQRHRLPGQRNGDATYLSLRAKSRTANSPQARRKADLEFANYLVQNAGRNSNYAKEADAILRQAVSRISGGTALSASEFVSEISLLHRLYRKAYPHGLDAKRWSLWSNIVDRISASAGDKHVAELASELIKSPLRPSTRTRWLPKSYLDNRGFWRQIPRSFYAGAALAELKARTVHVRKSGQFLIGTSHGLFARQNGIWVRYVFDETLDQLRLATLGEEGKASSDVLKIAEDEKGVLWLGTANGLIKVESKFGGPATRFVTPKDGLPSPRIDSLVAVGARVLAGTPKGLAIFDGHTLSLVDVATFKKEIRFLRVAEAPFSDEAASGSTHPGRLKLSVLAATREGLYALEPTSPENHQRLTDFAVDDAIVLTTMKSNRVMRRLMILQGTQVRERQWGAKGSFAPLPGDGDILYSKLVYGFAPVAVEGTQPDAVAVLTDQGLSIWRDGHFEHKKLPLSDSNAPVIAMAGRQQTYLLVSDKATIYAIERGNVFIDSSRPVYDLLTDPVLKATYVARGRRLEIVFHGKPGAPPKVDYIGGHNARHLDLTKSGELIFDSGRNVMRIKRGSDAAEILFAANPSSEERTLHYANHITSLVAAKDGSIWVTIGPSVFRWRNGKVAEFNFFVDREKFPIPNHRLSRVLETHDGRIWVVASNETHLKNQGYKLRYGLLEFRGDRFVQLDPKRKHGIWFFTGYTKIGEGNAIFGTTSGFGRHRGHALELLTNSTDESYQRLLSSTPQLFLGRRGTKLGRDVWLFPSAGGLVGYRNGLWFYPDRINWMLPDQHLARYGARTVHAVASDENGRIYAGTDRGLMIYDPGGGSEIGFLVSNQMADVAFTATEQQKLRKQRDILFKRLKKSDPRYKQIKKFQRLQHEIDALAIRVAERESPSGRFDSGDTKSDAGSSSAGTNGISAHRRSALKERLRRKQKNLALLLARLERDSYALFQLLQLKPVELASLQKEIAQDELVVQFLPTADELYIHTVSRENRAVRKVKISQANLEEAVQTVRSLMRTAVERTGSEKSGAGGEQARASAHDPDLTKVLHRLHEILIRPIMPELAGKKNIYFVPVGALSYMPFSALVESIDGKPRYLAERFAVGQIPSLYLFDLALRRVPSLSDQMLIYGDPDGSLEFARTEAKMIASIKKNELTSVVKVGEEATYDQLTQAGPASRIIHLATHGLLNQEEPELSYLVLAKRKLEMIDVQLLNLKETDLVYLSACETGIGRRGLEYATLAHSFAHAGVPAIVATLWKVYDDATFELAKRFYTAYSGKPLTAMAEAKQAMIKSRRFAHPVYWSGFVVFGKN